MRMVPLTNAVNGDEIWVDADRVVMVTLGTDPATGKKIIGTSIVLIDLGQGGLQVAVKNAPSVVSELLGRNSRPLLSMPVAAQS